MAKIKAKRKDSHIIIRAKLRRNEKLVDREFDFFKSRYVHGLFEAKKIKKNLIEYSGPVSVSLYDKLSQPVMKKAFYMIIEQVIDLQRKLKNNSLRASSVVLDLNSVFINEITLELNFLYLPTEGSLNSRNIMMFINDIIYSSKPEGNDTDFIARFIYFMRGLETDDLKKIEDYIYKEDRSVVDKFRKGAWNRRPERDISSEIDSGRTRINEFIVPPNYDSTMLMNNRSTTFSDEDTGLLNEDGTGILDDEATGFLDDDDDNTGILKQDAEKIRFPKLYRVVTDETIVIDKAVFRIGKEKSYADYFVSNNGAVSRNHCDIIVRGTRYFVMDLNSKNRTFINDHVIDVRQETEIFDGDRLRLANEDFIFYAG